MKIDIRFENESLEKPYSSFWGAVLNIVIETMITLPLLLVFLLFLISQVNLPIAAMAFLLAMLLTGLSGLLHSAFVFRVYRRSKDLWVHLGRPIIDFTKFDGPRCFGFLFIFPNHIDYSMSLKIHHYGCRALYILMLSMITIALILIYIQN